MNHIVTLAKALLNKVQVSLRLTPARLPPRPQLAGRHGYGDRKIKSPP
jgi:hypothetical protein